MTRSKPSVGEARREGWLRFREVHIYAAEMHTTFIWAMYDVDQ